MARAWDYLDAPGVEDSFAQVVLSRLSRFEGLTEDRQVSLFDTDGQKRLRVLEAVVRRLTNPEDAPILAQTHTPLAVGQDIPWLLGRLLAEESPTIQMAWAKLIWSVYNRHSREHLDAIFETCTKCSVLAEVFAPLFQPVMLDSPDAQKARHSIAPQSRWQQQLEERQRRNAPEAVLQRALTALAKYEAGSLDAWPIVTEAITTVSDAPHPSLRSTDIAASPAWQQAQAQTGTRFKQAAYSYVLSVNPDIPPSDSASGDDPVLAGYKALRLLFQTAPELLSTLPSDVWVRWAWVVLTYPLSSGYGDDDIPRALVKTAYQRAPEAVLSHLDQIIDDEDKRDDHIFVLARMRACWDERLAAFLLSKAKDPRRSLGGLSAIMDTLLAQDMAEAKEYAESHLTLPLWETEEARSIALAMGLLLMSHAQNASWPLIWPLMMQDVEFGRKLVEAAAATRGRNVEDFVLHLSEEQLADLYAWLVSQYPPDEDPSEFGFHEIGPRESVAHWRDALVTQLAERGTRASYDAVRRLTVQLPSIFQLRWLLLRAQIATLRRTWLSPSPEHVRQITADHQARLVRSGDELLEVLVESLGKLQDELQGEHHPSSSYGTSRQMGSTDPSRRSTSLTSSSFT